MYPALFLHLPRRLPNRQAAREMLRRNLTPNREEDPEAQKLQPAVAVTHPRQNWQPRKVQLVWDAPRESRKCRVRLEHELPEHRVPSTGLLLAEPIPGPGRELHKWPR